MYVCIYMYIYIWRVAFKHMLVSTRKNMGDIIGISLVKMIKGQCKQYRWWPLKTSWNSTKRIPQHIWSPWTFGTEGVVFDTTSYESHKGLPMGYTVLRKEQYQWETRLSTLKFAAAPFSDIHRDGIGLIWCIWSMWVLGHASQLLRSLRLWHWLPSLPGVLPFVSGLWPWSPVVLDTSSQQPVVCLGSHRCPSRRESWEMVFPWIHLVNPTHFLIFLGCGVDYPPNLNNFGKWARVFLLVYHKCHISIQLHGLQPTKKSPQDLQTLFRQVNGSAVGVPHFQTRKRDVYPSYV